jgi:hypothetical protein
MSFNYLQVKVIKIDQSVKTVSPGRAICRSKIAGLDWLPMRNTSQKPLVVTKAVRSPLRSSSALVATVVPMLCVGANVNNCAIDKAPS